MHFANYQHWLLVTVAVIGIAATYTAGIKLGSSHSGSESGEYDVITIDSSRAAGSNTSSSLGEATTPSGHESVNNHISVIRPTGAGPLSDILDCTNCKQAADTLQQLSCQDLKSRAPWVASRVRSCYSCKVSPFHQANLWPNQTDVDYVVAQLLFEQYGLPTASCPARCGMQLEQLEPCSVDKCQAWIAQHPLEPTDEHPAPRSGTVQGPLSILKHYLAQLHPNRVAATFGAMLGARSCLQDASTAGLQGCYARQRNSSAWASTEDAQRIYAHLANMMFKTTLQPSPQLAAAGAAAEPAAGAAAAVAAKPAAAAAAAAATARSSSSTWQMASSANTSTACTTCYYDLHALLLQRRVGPMTSTLRRQCVAFKQPVALTPHVSHDVCSPEWLQGSSHWLFESLWPHPKT
jgi:hypothetical protein